MAATSAAPASSRRAHPGGARLAIGVLAGIAALALTSTGLGLTPTRASFVDSGAAAGSFQAMTVVAATGLTCTSNADNTVTLAWSYPNGTPTSFDVLFGSTGSTVIASVTGDSRSVVIQGKALLALGTTQLRIRTNVAPTWPMPVTAGTPVTVLSLLGLGGVRCGT